MKMNKRMRDTDDDAIPLNIAKRPKLLDDTHFKIIEYDDKTQNILASCMHCSKKIKGKLSSTGNFFKHIRSCHESLFQSIKGYCEHKPAEEEKSSSSQTKQTKLPFSSSLDEEKVSNFGLLLIYSSIFCE